MSVLALLESSFNSSTLPVSKPLASGPLSESSCVGCALLALSHPDSDDSALSCLFGYTFCKAFQASLVSGADFAILIPSSDDHSTLKAHRTVGASDELLLASLILSTFLAVSDESFEQLIGCAWSNASGPGVWSISEDCAVVSSLVLELLDDALSDRLANLSDCLRRSPDNASVSSILEFFDNFGILHNVSPDASSMVNGTSFGYSALLKSSLELFDDSSGFNLLWSSLSDTSLPFSVSELSDLAIQVILFEFLYELGFGRNLIGNVIRIWYWSYYHSDRFCRRICLSTRSR